MAADSMSGVMKYFQQLSDEESRLLDRLRQIHCERSKILSSFTEADCSAKDAHTTIEKRLYCIAKVSKLLVSHGFSKDESVEKAYLESQLRDAPVQWKLDESDVDWLLTRLIGPAVSDLQKQLADLRGLILSDAAVSAN